MNKEIPSSRELLPDIKRILDEVCKSYGVEDTEIFKMKRGKTNEARSAAIYLTRKLRMDTFKIIGGSVWVSMGLITIERSEAFLSA